MIVWEEGLRRGAYGRVPTAALSRFLADVQKALKLCGEVDVLLASDATIAKMNKQYRGKRKPTDVLSFPAQPDNCVGDTVAGDLAISIETAAKQAAEQRHSLATELKVLLLHGAMHLAGYDHETDDGEMLAREHRLRSKFGLPAGLIERVRARA